MPVETWTVFVAVALAAVLSPGPAMLAILGHALARGASAAAPVVLGNGVGVVLMMGASVLGLSAFIASIPHGLEALKWTGAAYLAWLGIQAWRAQPREAGPALVPEAGRHGFAKGLGIALSNPKALLFFGAVLPQFVTADRPLLPQFGVLAGTFAAFELVTTGAVAYGAAALAPVLRRPGAPRFANRVSGAVMILAALLLVAAPLSARTTVAQAGAPHDFGAP